MCGNAIAAVGRTAMDRIGDGVGAGVIHCEGLTGELHVVGRARIHRVFIDSVALHNIVVNVQGHDAVATVGGGGLQDELTVDGINDDNLDFGCRGSHCNACARSYRDANPTVLLIGEGLGFGLACKTELRALLGRRCRFHRQLQEGNRIKWGSIHHHRSVKLVESVRVGG